MLDVLRSLVCVFFKPLPAWISPSKPPMFGAAGRGPAPPAGGGGGGGAPPLGIGGGGGAPALGIGGGGGAPPFGIGGGDGEKAPGMGGGGGGAADGDETSAPGDLTPAGDCGVGEDVSKLDSGRGGAMVPKRIEASCLALPPVGPESSSEESSSESTTDQSSSSLGTERVRAGAALGSGSCVLACSLDVMR